MDDIKKIKKDLKVRLSKYRYDHSLRVASEAKKMARRYGVDEAYAYLAGLVHDVAKEFSLDENKEWIDKYNLSSELLSDDNRKILHAEIGSVVAKELYGVSDEVVNAIKYHTVGNVDMSLLAKVVFVADKIECGKDYPGIELERILAYQDIDEALIKCLENQKEKLTKENKVFNEEADKLLRMLVSKREAN